MSVSGASLSGFLETFWPVTAAVYHGHSFVAQAPSRCPGFFHDSWCKLSNADMLLPSRLAALSNEYVQEILLLGLKNEVEVDKADKYWAHKLFWDECVAARKAITLAQPEQMLRNWMSDLYAFARARERQAKCARHEGAVLEFSTSRYYRLGVEAGLGTLGLAETRGWKN